MGYKYYVQEYAKKRADSILPVPENYPLRGDFGLNFFSDFSELTKILRKIYVDVTENPAAYECDLYPLKPEEGALIMNQTAALTVSLNVYGYSVIAAKLKIIR